MMLETLNSSFALARNVEALAGSNRLIVIIPSPNWPSLGKLLLLTNASV